jgi:hypothetical protein
MSVNTAVSLDKKRRRRSNILDANGQPRFKCPECDKPFARKEFIQRHRLLARMSSSLYQETSLIVWNRLASTTLQVCFAFYPPGTPRCDRPNNSAVPIATLLSLVQIYSNDIQRLVKAITIPNQGERNRSLQTSLQKVSHNLTLIRHIYLVLLVIRYLQFLCQTLNNLAQPPNRKVCPPFFSRSVARSDEWFAPPNV